MSEYYLWIYMQWLSREINILVKITLRKLFVCKWRLTCMLGQSYTELRHKDIDNPTNWNSGIANIVNMVTFSRRYFKPTVDGLPCYRCATITKGTCILIELSEVPDNCFNVSQLCVLRINWTWSRHHTFRFLSSVVYYMIINRWYWII